MSIKPSGHYWTTRTNNTSTPGDEYPFATSNEGGGNTFPRSPAILRCVSGSENSSGRSQLVNFVTASQGVPGDTYAVGFYPPPPGITIPFCSPSSGFNDGTEFKYNGGGGNNYVIARRDLADSGFSEVEARASNTTAKTWPIWKTSEGSNVVLFSPVKVGAPVWDDAKGRHAVLTEKLHDDFAAFWATQEKANAGAEPKNAALSC